MLQILVHPCQVVMYGLFYECEFLTIDEKNQKNHYTGLSIFFFKYTSTSLYTGSTFFSKFENFLMNILYNTL